MATCHLEVCGTAKTEVGSDENKYPWSMFHLQQEGVQFPTRPRRVKGMFSFRSHLGKRKNPVRFRNRELLY